MTQISEPKPAYSTQTFDCIVALAQSIRATWETPGLRDAIRKAMQRDDQPTLAEIAYAVVRCAENFTVVSPAVIPMDGPHWRKVIPDHVPPSAIRCPRCGSLDMPDQARDHKCKKRTDRAAVFTDQLRAELADVRSHQCLHGVDPKLCADCQRARADATEEATT